MSDFTIYTIGHSTHAFPNFLGLLNATGINAIADVRSSPWSKHFPQYNRDELKLGLRNEGLEYRFFGKMLGGRPDDPALFDGVVADYEAMAKVDTFAEGISRVISGAKKHRLALMCSEHDPMDCHRCLLVGRELGSRGGVVKHVLASGDLLTQREIEGELLVNSGRFSDDFFLSREEQLNQAYRDRAKRVAYKDRSGEEYLHDEDSDVEYS